MAYTYDANTDPSGVMDPDELAAILRAKQMQANAPPPPDPYGRPQPVPPPDAQIAAATTVDPMTGKPLPAAQGVPVQAMGPQQGQQAQPAPPSPDQGSQPYGRPSVSTQELRDALDAYTKAASTQAPARPAWYGQRVGPIRSLIMGGQYSNYETQMGQRQAGIDAAAAKLKGLEAIEQVEAQAEERKARGQYYAGGGHQSGKDRYEALLADIAQNQTLSPDQKKQALDAIAPIGEQLGFTKPASGPKLSGELGDINAMLPALPGESPQDHARRVLAFAVQFHSSKEPPAALQLVQGSDGKSYLLNPRTGEMREPTLPGGQSGRAAAAPPPSAPPVNAPTTALGQIVDSALPQGAPALASAPPPPPLSFSKGSAGVGAMTKDDVKATADAVEQGLADPTLKGLYRNAGPVRAELARRGFDLAKAATEWNATQKFTGTMNNQQQVRMRQNIDFASSSLGNIDDIYKQLRQALPDTGFKSINKINLAAMKQIPGQTGALAQQLDSNIADLTAELGNVYMGGNSPTDHALDLASRNLQGNWNQDQFEGAVGQIRKNLGYRKNSLSQSSPVGAGRYSKQTQSVPDVAPATTPTLSKSGRPIKQNAAGQWIYAD